MDNLTKLEIPLVKAESERVVSMFQNSAEGIKEELTPKLIGLDEVGITNDEQRAAAVTVADSLNTYAKDLEKQREDYVKPFLEGQRAVNNSVKPLINFMQDGARKLKQKIMDYDKAVEAEVQRIQQEALGKVLQNPEADLSDQVEAVLNAQPKEPPKPKTKGYKEIPVLEIVSMDVEKIPREFLQPNESKIKAFLKESKANAILGVKHKWGTKAGL